MIELTYDPTRGDWLIELDETGDINSNLHYQPMSRVLFAWIAQEVTRQLDLPSKLAVLTVVEAEYLGVYPCLAAQYTAGKFPQALADEIEAAIRRLLVDTTLQQFALSIPRFGRFETDVSSEALSGGAVVPRNARQDTHSNGARRIELSITENISANPEYRPLAKVLFDWIAQNVSHQLNLASQSSALKAVGVDYYGIYPCLAVQPTEEEIPESTIDEIKEATRNLLANTTMTQFAKSFPWSGRLGSDTAIAKLPSSLRPDGKIGRPDPPPECTLYTRYWFTFRPMAEGPLKDGFGYGCGVSAFDKDDAISLLKSRVFGSGVMPGIESCVENIDISTLDKDQVAHKMSKPDQRGIWFPLGY